VRPGSTKLSFSQPGSAAQRKGIQRQHPDDGKGAVKKETSASCDGHWKKSEFRNNTRLKDYLTKKGGEEKEKVSGREEKGKRVGHWEYT